VRILDFTQILVYGVTKNTKATKIIEENKLTTKKKNKIQR